MREAPTNGRLVGDGLPLPLPLPLVAGGLLAGPAGRRIQGQLRKRRWFVAAYLAALHFLVYFSVVHGAFAHGVGVRCDDAGAFVDARSAGAGSLVGGT
jgi:hypothetical protein